MPAGMTQQIDRTVDSRLNSGSGDAIAGQSTSSGTGQSSYGGQVGARLALGPTDIRSNAAVGTLFGGIYQYVFMTFTTQQPVRGRFVSWDLSVAESLYQVNGDAKPSAAVPTLIAGVVINTAVLANTFAWMQTGGRASCLFDSAITGAAAGNMVSAKVSPAVASTFDVGATVVTATTPVTVMAAVGVAETIPVISTISVVQLFNWLSHRRI